MSESCYFVVVTCDKPDSLDLRARIRPIHRTYLRAQRDVCLYAAGPLCSDDDDAMNGSFFLCGAASRTQVEAFLAADPYNQSGLTESVIIRRLDWTLGAPSESNKDDTVADSAIR
jgi:uncharacterized protein YciI